VTTTSTHGTAVSCWHNPGGTRVANVTGLVASVLDGGVTVQKPTNSHGGSSVLTGKLEPSLAGVPSIPGGHKVQLLTMHLHDAVGIGGSHMAVFEEQAPDGGNMVVVVLIDGKGNLVPGSYTASLSNHYLTIEKVGKGGKLAVAYQKPVYS
jgi:hypothetical protein